MDIDSLQLQWRPTFTVYKYHNIHRNFSNGYFLLAICMLRLFKHSHICQMAKNASVLILTSKAVYPSSLVGLPDKLMSCLCKKCSVRLAK